MLKPFNQCDHNREKNMKKFKLMIMLCLVFLTINDSQSVLINTPPIGFKHIGNSKATIQNPSYTHHLDGNDMQLLIAKKPVTYLSALNGQHIIYNIALNEQNEGDVSVLPIYFSVDNMTSSWLEYKNSVKIKGVTSVTYILKTTIGNKTSTIGTYLMDIKRSTPTFASRDTINQHETHLPFEALKQPFEDQERWYLLDDSDIAYVHSMVEQNEVDEGEPKVVLKAFYNKDRGVMEGALHVNGNVDKILDFEEVNPPISNE